VAKIREHVTAPSARCTHRFRSVGRRSRKVTKNVHSRMTAREISSPAWFLAVG
jgi:hypothetical protein